MDLLEIVRVQVNSLPGGPHQTGLKSVLRHIETAYRHLSRGQHDGDDSAYSDAIYRCNQAYEGSIKEAYRTLAEKDPQRARTFDIEQYLQQSNLFRPRVLSQFTTYRTEWRNPSTHDYNLDFDEDEAFLAIVSVSAFSKMLIDQIAEKLAFVSVRDDVALQGDSGEARIVGKSLIDEATSAFLSFLSEYAPSRLQAEPSTEAQLLGALSAYLASIDPEIEVRTNYVAKGPSRDFEIDMLVSRGKDSLIVELKRGTRGRNVESALNQLTSALQYSNIKAGILLIQGSARDRYHAERHDFRGDLQLTVIAPDE